ncbi:T9SS type A sorting domain-containing protein [Cryomorpha ignava]|uniref:T9SS type A sorting domain-containing protein n=1 Tax=Cryomorpha ignava TaxID=101383 RepID=A0A7K3WTX4_9FLAO|nr:T9SS type A sorting domain-containing protein [Cryomorpha ignava]NEN24105.1 T9SS type A sorting domain-containing protein [Cryomorpha ignava]
MKTIFTTLFAIGIAHFSFAQSYTSWLSGSAQDLEVQPDFGICLMGGGIESDPAMVWFLEKANGGDVVVLRTSQSDGYNNYMYNQLGVSLNSVETIRFNSAAAANDPYVIERLNGAEAIFMAGGDQSYYVNYWRDTPVEEAINNLLNVRGGVVGGTSAGMAVMAQGYFSAQNGSIDSDEALANPFDNYLTLGWNDFVDAPFLENAITDTHFNERDRYGRLLTFMARLINDHNLEYAHGVASNEHVAIAIGADGLAHAYGEYPEYSDEFAYFLQSNCEVVQAPEIIESNQPLTWNRNSGAVKVYRVPATESGENFFDLNDWISGSGGTWENWYAENGTLTRTYNESAPDCILGLSKEENQLFRLYPNPASTELKVEFLESFSGKWQIVDIAGRVVMSGRSTNIDFQSIDLSKLNSGAYTLMLNSDHKTISSPFLKTR